MSDTTEYAIIWPFECVVAQPGEWEKDPLVILNTLIWGEIRQSVCANEILADEPIIVVEEKK